MSERRWPLPIDPRMEPAVLALNNAHAAELSWLEVERLRSLVAQAFYARRIGKLDAFLLAFDQMATRPTRHRMRCTARWNLPRSARRAFTEERRRFVISPAQSSRCPR